jgi:uncharacterized protein (TIGR00369 family)
MTGRFVMNTRDTVDSGSKAFSDMIEGRRLAPSSELLGLKILSVDAEAGTMETEFEATAQFVNAGGSIHGGFITAMLDETMSYAGTAFFKGTHVLPTLEIKTSFMRPAFVGRLFGTGKLLHHGRDLVFLEGSLRDKNAKLIATATATARIITIEELRARLAGKEALATNWS